MILAKKPKHCLVTITSPKFLTGTLVMLHSFLKYNPWFKGDILIYDTDLSENHRVQLLCFPNVQFPKPDSRLLKRIQLVTLAHPRIAHKHMVFHSLNLFQGLGYQKYLYIDSDAFFRGNIEELMSLNHGLMCVADRATYLGKAKDSMTYQIAQNPDNSERYWYRTFNAGIMFVDSQLVGQKIYEDLLQLVHPKQYDTLLRPTTDQYLLNRYFRDTYYRLSASYNFRLGIAKEVATQEGITLETAKIIHFTGQKNPWEPQQVMKAARNFDLYYRAFEMWNSEYLDYIRSVRHNK